MNPLQETIVNWILMYAYSADEVHAEVDRAVEWIEAHPRATRYADGDS